MSIESKISTAFFFRLQHLGDSTCAIVESFNKKIGRRNHPSLLSRIAGKGSIGLAYMPPQPIEQLFMTKFCIPKMHGWVREVESSNLSTPTRVHMALIREILS